MASFDWVDDMLQIGTRVELKNDFADYCHNKLPTYLKHGTFHVVGFEEHEGGQWVMIRSFDNREFLFHISTLKKAWFQ